MKVSVLDQSPVTKGNTATQSLKNTVELAMLADELGYHRMWMAEHHNTKNFASSAPEVTAAYLAAKTKRLRLGTGGVMMMHYSPYKLAEVFKTLSALAPGRIDFGVGRAPGGDHLAMQALAEGRRYIPSDLYDKFTTILQLLNDESPNDAVYQNLVTAPFDVPLPEAWLLGSSGNSAVRAGRLGVGYSFAQFFNGELSKDILDAYKYNFTPSSYMEKPLITVTYAVTIAETKEEAEYIAKPVDLSRLFLSKGNLRQTLTPEEAKDFPLSEMDQMIIERNRRIHLVGTADEIAKQLYDEKEKYGFDEVMINSTPHSHESRLQVYRLLAKEMLQH